MEGGVLGTCSPLAGSTGCLTDQESPRYVVIWASNHAGDGSEPKLALGSSMEALKMEENENKFLFMHLHSPEQPFTPSFCWKTLCSELLVQCLDANFSVESLDPLFFINKLMRPESGLPLCG
ncbi:hypothetical protein FNV43_RR15920 [Rhamnella rubrinervis]|uniref:Uncharacterized protein n=1 Tax=Rhamnella rubrinervis TaxID=2594499 RepID=A0A8K0E9T6_9ROSA|nr:hypothetical protein FNV43_RR15920 [Rhamnella rubrinervis]